ncbi:MAG: hypothetical protein RL069_2122, partial [Planctomycetota bacterium]
MSNHSTVNNGSKIDRAVNVGLIGIGFMG